MSTNTQEYREKTIPSGYKQTEIGLIPEDWEVVTIGDLSTKIVGGGTPSRIVDSYWNGKIPWMTVKDFNFNGRKYPIESITDNGLRNSSSNLIPKGTVITSTRMALGKAVIYDIDVAINQDLKAIFTNDRILPLYFYYWFQFNEGNLEGIGSGSTVKGISLNDLRNIKVALPKDIQEQTAIANALSDVDELIGGIEQLIHKKQMIKKAAMQALLSGKIRLQSADGRQFDGEWEEKRLGEVGTFSKGKGIRKSEVDLSSDNPCIRYGEIYTHHNNFIHEFISFIPDDIASKSKRINKGDVLFAGSGETKEEIGKCVAYLYDKEAYAGGDIIIFTPYNSNSLFLGYLLNSDMVNKQKSSKAQGDAVVHLYSRNLSEITINIPTRIEEQDAIAAVLSDMDAELVALEEKREKVVSIKRGMMQELLSGKVRVVE